MTLDNPQALFILTKAQVLRETLSALGQFRRTPVMRELVDSVIRDHTARVMAINNADELDDYLSDTRRLSLADWLESLTWDHTQGDSA